VVTLQALTPFLDRRSIPPVSRRLQAFLQRDSARRARRIIAISDYIRRGAVQCLDVPAQRIDVVHHGCDPSLIAMDAGLARGRLSRQYGIGRPFILVVASTTHLKNPEAVLELARHLRRQYDDRYLIVHVGIRGPSHAGYRRTLEREGLSTVLRFLEFVPYAEMSAFYSAARLLFFPSFTEGFGLPLLEAMQCGLPVVSWLRGAVPEVCGSAARMASGPEGLPAAVDSVLMNDDLHRTLAEDGRNRARQFTWAKAARETLRAYDACLGGDPVRSTACSEPVAEPVLSGRSE
jgi:glycosyltransferase involved in cell wall biosynthesis